MWLQKHTTTCGARGDQQLKSLSPENIGMKPEVYDAKSHENSTMQATHCAANRSKTRNPKSRKKMPDDPAKVSESIL